MFALNNQPTYYILTIHFSNFIKCFGQDEVRSAMNLLNTELVGSEFIWEDPLERHIGNLVGTYGKDVVFSFYNTIYGFKTKSEVA